MYRISLHNVLSEVTLQFFPNSYNVLKYANIFKHSIQLFYLNLTFVTLTLF